MFSQVSQVSSTQVERGTQYSADEPTVVPSYVTDEQKESYQLIHKEYVTGELLGRNPAEVRDAQTAKHYLQKWYAPILRDLVAQLAHIADQEKRSSPKSRMVSVRSLVKDSEGTLKRAVLIDLIVQDKEKFKNVGVFERELYDFFRSKTYQGNMRERLSDISEFGYGAALPMPIAINHILNGVYMAAFCNDPSGKIILDNREYAVSFDCYFRFVLASLKYHDSRSRLRACPVDGNMASKFMHKSRDFLKNVSEDVASISPFVKGYVRYYTTPKD